MQGQLVQFHSEASLLLSAHEQLSAQEANTRGETPLQSEDEEEDGALSPVEQGSTSRRMPVEDMQQLLTLAEEL